MNNITKDLEPLKNKLRNHTLYNNIDSIEDLKLFSNAHVYAVWDFMSLLKFLQINLTSLSIPWFPSKNTTTAKLINEIVAGEETDEDQNGEPVSHFEMYIDSIEAFGLNTSNIFKNLNTLKELKTIESDIDKLEIKDYIKDFLKYYLCLVQMPQLNQCTFQNEILVLHFDLHQFLLLQQSHL